MFYRRERERAEEERQRALMRMTPRTKEDYQADARELYVKFYVTKVARPEDVDRFCDKSRKALRAWKTVLSERQRRP